MKLINVLNSAGERLGRDFELSTAVLFARVLCRAGVGKDLSFVYSDGSGTVPAELIARETLQQRRAEETEVGRTEP